jgi:hypothetical protein
LNKEAHNLHMYTDLATPIQKVNIDKILGTGKDRPDRKREFRDKEEDIFRSDEVIIPFVTQV